MLVTPHPDGLAHADFAVVPDGELPSVMLSAGHGEWNIEGDGVAIALLALLVDGEGRFAGTVELDGQGRMGADGQSLDGAFAYSRSSLGGKKLSDGRGAMHSKLIPLNQ